MKESERLTVYIAGYAHGYGFIGGTPPRRTKNVCRGRFDATFCVDRLAAYEETGLSPEEVEKLKAENAELTKEADENAALSMQSKMRADRLEAENAELRARLEASHDD